MKEKNDQNNGVPQQGGAAQAQPVLDPLQPTGSNGPCTNVAQRSGAKFMSGQDNTGPSHTPQPKVQRNKTRMGFVYAIQMVDTNRWKIGWVKSRESLKDHLARLQRGYGQRLEVRALKAMRMAEKNRLRWALSIDGVCDRCSGELLPPTLAGGPASMADHRTGAMGRIRQDQAPRCLARTATSVDRTAGGLAMGTNRFNSGVDTSSVTHWCRSTLLTDHETRMMGRTAMSMMLAAVNETRFVGGHINKS